MKLYKHKKLHEALDVFVRQQNDLLPDEKELSEVTLSDAFKERMQKLLRRQKYGFFVLFGTAGRRVASILMAVLVAAAVTTVSVEALRKPVMEFFTQVFERFTQIFFVDDTPDTRMVEMELYLPTHIPEGYELEQEEVLPYIHRTTYTHSYSNDKIRYKQRWKESINVFADTENTNYSKITVNDYQGIAYSNKDIVSLIYSDEQYTYTLSASLPLEKLIEIAKSIEKK